MAHNCGWQDNQTMFRDNIAHSIQGYGATIFTWNSDQTIRLCIAASHFTAYKCAIAGITGNMIATEVQYSNLVMIDNTASVAQILGVYGDELYGSLFDSIFYGESPARDCPKENVCQYKGFVTQGPGTEQYLPFCHGRQAIMLTAMSGNNKPPVISGTPYWPQYHIKEWASFGGRTFYTNLTFANFENPVTWCGEQQVLFIINPFAADYTPPVELQRSKFIVSLTISIQL